MPRWPDVCNHRKPAGAVLAVLAEAIQGIEEQIAGLRVLARGLVERQIAARRGQEVAQLVDAHSRAASRIAKMIAAEKLLAKDGQEDTWAENLLAGLDKIALAEGDAPVSEGIREAAAAGSGAGQGGDPGLEIVARGLVEEIATVRYMLRNVLELALQTQELPVYIRLVEIYGSGCVRLVRMLKKDRRDHSQLRRYLEEQIDVAIGEVLQEWGWEV